MTHVNDVAAIESISQHFYRTFARRAGAEVIESEKLSGAFSHIPVAFFNGIARTQLDATEVRDAFESLRGRGTPFRWWVTPSSRPNDLGAILRSFGLHHAYDAPGMIADLSLLLDRPVPDDIVIDRAASADDLRPYFDVLMPVFAIPESVRESWLDAYAQCGFGDDAPWMHFVARDRGVPVATTSLLMAGDLAGIYNVATVSIARGRGIGAAVTRAAMQHARDRGATRAVLQSSDAGYNVYRSLGFEQRCVVSAYEWRLQL